MTRPLDYAVHHVKSELHTPGISKLQCQEIISTLLTAIDGVQDQILTARQTLENLEPKLADMSAKTVVELTLDFIEDAVAARLYGVEI